MVKWLNERARMCWNEMHKQTFNNNIRIVIKYSNCDVWWFCSLYCVHTQFPCQYYTYKVEPHMPAVVCRQMGANTQNKQQQNNVGYVNKYRDFGRHLFKAAARRLFSEQKTKRSTNLHRFAINCMHLYVRRGHYETMRHFHSFSWLRFSEQLQVIANMQPRIWEMHNWL